MNTITTIRAWLRSLTPWRRRTMAKRRLETHLHAHGIGKERAKRITWLYFNDKKATNDR